MKSSSNGGLLTPHLDLAQLENHEEAFYHFHGAIGEGGILVLNFGFEGRVVFVVLLDFEIEGGEGCSIGVFFILFKIVHDFKDWGLEDSFDCDGVSL